MLVSLYARDAIAIGEMGRILGDMVNPIVGHRFGF